MEDIQRLPQEFHAISRKDRGTYAVWFANNEWHRKQMPNMEQALDFVRRAEERKFPAYCTTYWNGENKVYEFSPYGPLAKYAFKDRVVLEIRSVAARILNEERNRVKRAGTDHFVKQWTYAEYGTLFPEIDGTTYEVSWFSVDEEKHIFKNKTFEFIEEARAMFNEFREKDIPCRLAEFNGLAIHEVAAANQHWALGSGNYAEQMVDGTLPKAELPYFFHGYTSVEELRIETAEDGTKWGSIQLYTGNWLYGKQRVFDLTISGTEVHTHVAMDEFNVDKTIYDMYVIDNPMFTQCIAKIRGRYLGGHIL